MLALGRAALIAGNIMNFHTSFAKAYARNGCFSFEPILVCNAVQTSSTVECPSLIFTAQSKAATFK